MNINQARNQIRATLLLEIRGEIKTDQSQPRVYNISKDVMHSLQNLVLCEININYQHNEFKRIFTMLLLREKNL